MRSPRTFYGIRRYEFAGLNGAAHVDVFIADPEKAVLDCLSNDALAGGFGELLDAIRHGLTAERLAVDQLIQYAVEYPNRAVAHRLGYLLSRNGVTASVLDTLRASVRRTGYPPRLSSSAEFADAERDREWNLLVNVPPELLAEQA
jgi:predicted transcriptional regulator of viral defense system